MHERKQHRHLRGKKKARTHFKNQQYCKVKKKKNNIPIKQKGKFYTINAQNIHDIYLRFTKGVFPLPFLSEFHEFEKNIDEI